MQSSAAQKDRKALAVTRMSAACLQTVRGSAVRKTERLWQIMDLNSLSVYRLCEAVQ